MGQITLSPMFEKSHIRKEWKAQSRERREQQQEQQKVNRRYIPGSNKIHHSVMSAVLLSVPFFVLAASSLLDACLSSIVFI